MRVIAFGRTTLRRHRVVLEDLALEHPHLDAAGTVSRVRLGASGIRITCGGRLGGAEITRVEWYKEGRVPLHTLRADIEYGFTEAHTTYGSIGVKAWVFHGEVLPTARKTTPQGPVR